MSRRERRLWLLLSGLLILGMLAASCTPAAAPPSKGPASEPAATPAVGAPGATPKPAGEQPRSGGILTVNTSYPDPQDIDLVSDHTVSTVTLIRPAYSGLLQYDPLDQGKIVPELAERWEMSPDGKVYTFYLRKGVKWHDGKPFTSADGKFTLERMIDPNDPEKIRLLVAKRESMSGIASVETPDPDTLKVTLQLRRGSFIPWIAWGPMVMGPKHIPIANLANTAVGTGAFKFKSYARGSSLELVKNPDYFIKGRPYLDGIAFYIIKDVSTTMAAFKTRRIHLVRNVLPSKAKEIKDLPGAVLDVSDKLSFGYFGMNASKPPFSDIRIRRAAFLAIDRPAAVDVLGEGYGSIGTLMPPGEWSRPMDEILKMPGYRKPKDLDIADAKKLMAEAGFPDGIKTTLLTSSRIEYERAAVFLKDQLAKVGIDAALDMKEFATYTKERAVASFAVTAAGPGSAYIPDPAGHKKYYGRENFVGLKDDRIFELIDQQDAATDPAERKKMLWEMENRLMDQAAIVLLYWANQVTGFWPEVKNFKDWSQYNNHAYVDVWLAK